MVGYDDNLAPQHPEHLNQQTIRAPLTAGFFGGMAGGAVTGFATSYSTTVAMTGGSLNNLGRHVGTLKHCLDQLIQDCKNSLPSLTSNLSNVNPIDDRVLQIGNSVIQQDTVSENTIYFDPQQVSTIIDAVEPKLPDSLPQLCQNLLATYQNNVPEIVSESCTTLESLASQTNFSAYDLTQIERACHNLAETAGRLLPENYSSLCQSLMDNATKQYWLTTTCANPSLQSACHNIVDYTLENMPHNIAMISEQLRQLSDITPNSVENLQHIQNACLSLSDGFRDETISQNCQKIIESTTAAFVEASCQSSSQLFTQACSDIAHHAFSSTAPQAIIDQLSELKTMLAPEVLTQAQVHEIATQCQDLTNHFTDQSTIQAIQDACQSIVREAAKKITYTEMLENYSSIGLEFLNQYLAQPAANAIATGIEYGVFKPAEYTARGVEGLSALARENISSEAVATTCEATKQAIVENPWVSLGVALGVLATSTAVIRYRQSIADASYATASGIVGGAHATKNGVIYASTATKNGLVSAGAATKNGLVRTSSATKNGLVRTGSATKNGLTFLYSSVSDTASQGWNRFRGRGNTFLSVKMSSLK